MQQDKPKRTNLTWACDICKKSKVKCSGGNPCQRCQNRRVQCVYSPQKKRGFAPKKRQKFENEKTFFLLNNVIIDGIIDGVVNEPPRKVQRTPIVHSPIITSPPIIDGATILKRKIETIVPENSQSKEMLDIYGKYFHNQLTFGTVDLENIMNPTKELHYFCRMIGYLYNLPFIYPEKVQSMQQLLYSYGNHIQNNVEFDCVLSLALMMRYTIGISESLFDEWRTKALKLFKQFVNIHNEPELFLSLYRVRTIITLTSSIIKNYSEDEVVDHVQDELIEILKLSDEEVQQKYNCPKAVLERFWNMVGDPVFRMYCYNSLRIDADIRLKLSTPPWLTEEQATCLSASVEKTQPGMKKSLGLQFTVPFVPRLYDVLRCIIQESINDGEECLKIARESLAAVKSELHLAQYSSFYVIKILPLLFKCFLRQRCIQEATDITNMYSCFSTLYPRMKELQELNRIRLSTIDSSGSVDHLFEKPISLQQLIQKETVIQFKTQVPSVLEPQTFCGPPNVFFNASPFL